MDTKSRMINENYTEDTQTGTILPSRKTRKQLVIATLLFCWTVIAWVVLYGDPINSLHQSAMAWSFASYIGVIFAYAFGAVIDNWNLFKSVIPNVVASQAAQKADDK